MKKITVLAAALLSAATLFGAENAIKNGTFEQLVAGKPANWIVKNSAGITFSSDGAPESGYVKFAPEIKDGKKVSLSFFQLINGAVKGNTKYTLSFKLRTGKGFRGRVRLLAINDKWQNGSGELVGGRFPTEWKEYKKVITMPEYKKDARFIVMAEITQGYAEIADIKLEEAAN